MRLLFAFLLGVAGTPALAVEWNVDPARSEIAFSGTNSGKPFRGTFTAWTAAVDFDPEKPEAAKVTVVVDLASAKTGDTTYDRTMPTRDWLDAATGPKAEFTTRSVKRGDGPGRFVADGTLSLRGIAVPVSLPFTLSVSGNAAEMTGRAELDRMAFAVGKSSDATGAWVSLAIPVDVKVVATRK